MNASGRGRAGVRRILLWSLLWIAVGVFFSTQMVVGRGNSAEVWATSLRLNLPRWILWGLLAILVLRFDRRIARGAGTLGRRVARHVPAGILFATIHIVLKKLVDGAIGLDPDWTVSGFLALYHWNLLIYTVIAGCIIAYDLHTEARDRELHATKLEARLAAARLDALKAQLHPHFLFNTLNAISAYMERDPATARRMMAHLGDLLRHSLDHADDQEIAFADELALARGYMAIQSLRFGGKLQYREDVAPDTLTARVPNLILQPLIENAVEHGLEQGGRSGTVTVTARGDDGVLTVCVRDTGVGIPADWTARQGVGLENTVARLEQLYGSRGSLRVENGEQTSVILTIPWHAGG